MGFTVDKQTFDTLVLEHLPAVQRFAIRLAGDADGGEEIAQEALLRAARSWQSFGGRSSFRTWLFQIVVNAFRDWLSLRKQPGQLPAELYDAQSPDPVSLASAGEMEIVVAAAVSTLPPRQREVLVMIVYQNVVQMDVAAILGISHESVRTNLHLARQRLRERLAGYLPEGCHER